MSVDSVGLNCPSCEAAVPADARFCMSCGQSLAPASDIDAARQARLAAATPPSLIEKMRSAKLTGERKPVTALFADVVGSTSLAERMDPEDWTQMMNEAFDLMSRAIFRYEGTIAQFQGDALLAFFGAPVAHEDDPERAVRAALEMVESTNEFARQLKQAHGIDFRIRVGINSGPVLVGNVGTDLRYEYTALGDAVNVAARVQTSAEPGTVLISAATQRFVSAV
ncbi:MAG TPA: adenylate/guanylate cyclase domain-containing protein, partial [Candidatus Limnocylindrales bacterium]